MKNLLFIALAFITLQVTAQDKKKENREDFKKERLKKLSEMNAKDMAQIQTKKMTLQLDLTDAQQQKVNAVNLKNAESRISKAKARLKTDGKKVKPSQKERVKLTNEKLDAQIAAKREMKAILNAEQYEKWQKTTARKGKGKEKKMRGKMKRKRERGENKNEDPKE